VVELAFVHSVPFTIAAAWALAVIPVTANNAVANIVASNFFNMFFPFFQSFFPTAMLYEITS
jgi:hypothetical protein